MGSLLQDHITYTSPEVVCQVKNSKKIKIEEIISATYTYEEWFDLHLKELQKQGERERRRDERHNNNNSHRPLYKGRVAGDKGGLARSYGDFFQDLENTGQVKFCWYATLTFRDPVHPESADKRFMRWLHLINRKALGVRYYKRSKGVSWVRGMETQRRGVIHFHALITGVEKLKRLFYMDEWDKIAGFARIYPYDRARGACHYISKYIAKGGEIDIGGEWVAVAMRQSNLNLFQNPLPTAIR